MGKKTIFITILATSICLAACSSGSYVNDSTPTLSILPSSALPESVQYCQNNTIEGDAPIFVNNISNNGLIVGGIYAPATDRAFPDMECSYQGFTSNGSSLDIESINKNAIDAYGAKIFSISDNGLLAGALTLDPVLTVAAISLNNQLQPIQPTVIPNINKEPLSVSAMNSNGTMLVGDYGNSGFPRSYIYDIENESYFIPALNVENLVASELTSISNNKIAVGQSINTNRQTLGLICSVESCKTYTQDPNVVTNLVSISENSQYIIGYQQNESIKIPFYLFENNGKYSVLNLESGFSPFLHSLTNNGISILVNQSADIVEDAYYFYNPQKYAYYNIVDFINSLKLNIDINENNGFRLSGISANGKYIYGYIKQASSDQELGSVTVPWKIYFPNGIDSALESFQPANIGTLHKNLDTKHSIGTTSKFMN